MSSIWEHSIYIYIVLSVSKKGMLAVGLSISCRASRKNPAQGNENHFDHRVLITFDDWFWESMRSLQMGGLLLRFPAMEVPKIINFNHVYRVFHYRPSILGNHIFRNAPKLGSVYGNAGHPPAAGHQETWSPLECPETWQKRPSQTWKGPDILACQKLRVLASEDWFPPAMENLHCKYAFKYGNIHIFGRFSSALFDCQRLCTVWLGACG